MIITIIQIILLGFYIKSFPQIYYNCKFENFFHLFLNYFFLLDEHLSSLAKEEFEA